MDYSVLVVDDDKLVNEFLMETLQPRTRILPIQSGSDSWRYAL